METKTQKRQPTRGVAIVLATLTVLVFIPMVGLAIDGSIAYLLKLKLSQAADAGCLAGARSLSRGGDIDSQRANATAVAKKYFDANLPAGYWGISGRSRTVSVDETVDHIRKVSITAVVDVPLYFMRMLGHTTVHLNITAQAQRRDVNVILVLDRSSSMQDAGAIAPLKTAAGAFVSNFAPGRDKVGLEVFGGSYVVAFHPATNFSPTVTTLISQMTGGGNTGTAQALWTAYQELVTLNEPGAMNVIVFFTDGLPNGITADYNALLKPASTCTSKTLPKIGYIAQWNGGFDRGSNTTAGVINHIAASVTAPNETATANSDGCAYKSDLTRMRDDIARMPAADVYGNATTGYKTVDLTRVDLPSQIKAASINAADNAATRIRADAILKPYIYVIGLGGTTSEGLDDTFMKRVANDRGSPIYDASKSTGLYVYSPTVSQLQDAFLRIASEILRLPQ